MAQERNLDRSRTSRGLLAGYLKGQNNQTNPQQKSGKRVLLDRNAWSYVADSGAGPDLLRAALRSHAEILVAPTVVFETLAIGDEQMRKRHMLLLTLPHWHRLMPDAYSKCMELLGEIKRLHPEWLRPQPDRERFRFQRHDWTRKKGGFWQIARENPAQLAEQLGIKEGWQKNLTDLARLEAQQWRDQFREDPSAENWRLHAVTGAPNFSVPGWNGDPVHLWRLAGWSTMMVALNIPGHPYSDWLLPEIDPQRLDPHAPSWGRFWFHEVDPHAMPRFWLQWAFRWLQGFQKYTPGTPADASLATYLPECDLFISADRNIIRNVIACKLDAPCPITDAQKIPGGTEGVDTVLKLIRSGL